MFSPETQRLIDAVERLRRDGLRLREEGQKLVVIAKEMAARARQQVAAPVRRPWEYGENGSGG